MTFDRTQPIAQLILDAADASGRGSSLGTSRKWAIDVVVSINELIVNRAIDAAEDVATALDRYAANIAERQDDNGDVRYEVVLTRREVKPPLS